MLDFSLARISTLPRLEKLRFEFHTYEFLNDLLWGGERGEGAGVVAAMELKSMDRLRMVEIVLFFFRKDLLFFFFYF